MTSERLEPICTTLLGSTMEDVRSYLVCVHRGTLIVCVCQPSREFSGEDTDKTPRSNTLSAGIRVIQPPSSQVPPDSLLWALSFGPMDWELTPPAVQAYIQSLQPQIKHLQHQADTLQLWPPPLGRSSKSMSMLNKRGWPMATMKQHTWPRTCPTKILPSPMMTRVPAVCASSPWTPRATASFWSKWRRPAIKRLRMTVWYRSWRSSTAG